jgi:hypothetical protein
MQFNLKSLGEEKLLLQGGFETEKQKTTEEIKGIKK